MTFTQAIECKARDLVPGGECGHLLDGESRVVRRVGGRAIYHLAFGVRGGTERVRLVRLEPGPFPPRTSHHVDFWVDGDDRVVITDAADLKRPKPFYLV